MTDFEDEFFRTHWQEQFGAIVRDKVGKLMDAQALSDLDPLSHTFQDPYDTDFWTVVYEDGEFYLSNSSWDESPAIVLDIFKLGVHR